MVKGTGAGLEFVKRPSATQCHERVPSLKAARQASAGRDFTQHRCVIGMMKDTEVDGCSPVDLSRALLRGIHLLPPVQRRIRGRPRKSRHTHKPQAATFRSKDG